MRPRAIPFLVGPLCGLISLLAPLQAQSYVATDGQPVRLGNSDMVILESQIVHKDLQCTVTPIDPTLGFDLRFHSGYDVTIPLKELIGEENQLTMLFRVTPTKPRDDEPGEPQYFMQHVRVPKIAEGAGGDAALSGIFDLGEGKYHVDWLMRDRSDRVCSHYWDSEAILNDKDRQITLEMTPGAIETAHVEQFTEDPPVQRNLDRPLNVKVMVNFAPQNPNSSRMRSFDTLGLVTLMRRLSREPRFGKFSVVAFNIAEQRVLYRQSSADRIDFPALGNAIRDVTPGVVSVKLLDNKRGEVEFLTDLIKKEMTAIDRPDALIFAGPKYNVENGTPDDELKPIAGGVDYPLFYLNYNLSPQANPWRDSIGRAIRVFDGKEYTITKPRDLWFSVTEIVNRIVESSQGRTPAVLH